MLSSRCPNCGATEFVADSVRLRQMPHRYFLVKCRQCGGNSKVVDSFQAVDLLRQGNIETKKIAGEILRRYALPVQLSGRESAVSS